MSTDDRLDRLEQRMAVLETLVRQLAAGGVARHAVAPPPSPRTPTPRGGLTGAPPAPLARDGGRSTAERDLGPPPTLRPPRPGPPPAAPPRGPRPGPRAPGSPALDSEQWIGQRVFLGIGVVALLMAAGYLLKLSFERGWISPVMRCIGGVVAGLGRRRPRLAARIRATAPTAPPWSAPARASST